MAEEEREQYISQVFLGTLNDFYKDSDAISKEWDAILARYNKGEDIMGDFDKFKSRRPRIFMLIDDIFHKEVDLEDKLDIARIGQEIRDKISEFKDRFAELADEIDMYVLTEIGASSTKISGI